MKRRGHRKIRGSNCLIQGESLSGWRREVEVPARGDGSQACIRGNAGDREDLPGAKGRQ